MISYISFKILHQPGITIVFLESIFEPKYKLSKSQSNQKINFTNQEIDLFRL